MKFGVALLVLGTFARMSDSTTLPEPPPKAEPIEIDVQQYVADCQDLMVLYQQYTKLEEQLNHVGR